MKASVFIATSLDGYIARLDGGIDWLPGDCEPHGYEEFIASIDAIVIGRGTYETVLRFGGWAYGKMPVFVLSRSMTELGAPPEAVCELMSGDPREIAERLEERGIGHIYVDRGITVQGFLRAELIQAHGHFAHSGALGQRHSAVRAARLRCAVAACYDTLVSERDGAERVSGCRVKGG